MNFTSKWVNSVQPPAEGHDEYMDGNSGLGLRVRSSGRKIWFARYTLDKKQARHNLGEFPAMPLVKAREALSDLLKKVGAGINPKGRSVSIDGMSVEWLCDDYIDRYAKLNKRSWKFDESILDKEVKPRWGKRHITAIRKQDVIALMDEIVDRGAPVHAGRVLACIAKMYNWAIDERGYLEQNPCYRVKAPKRANKRNRVLTETELVRFWHALDEPQRFSKMMSIIMKLGILLLQRRGEIIGMRVDELNLKQKLWMLPKERTKAGRAHIVPLPDQAIQLIRLATRLSPSKVYVFAINAGEPNSDDDGENRDDDGIAPMVVTGPTRAIHRNREWMKKRGIATFTFHDLRRTGASHMPRLGVPRDHVSLLLNHAQRGVTAEVYDWHEYLEEKRRALDIWAERVNLLVTGAIEPDDVKMEAVALEDEDEDGEA